MVKGVNELGSVICVEDTDTDSTYTPGLGLSLTDDVFSVNTNAIQVRVTGTCPEGQYIFAISPDGLVQCRDDEDLANEYSGDDFVVSNQVCPPGQVVAAVSAAGALVCVLDENTQNVYTGRDFAMSDQDCGPNKKVVGIDVEGRIVCSNLADVIYTAGAGLSLLEEEFSVAPQGVTREMLADASVDVSKIDTTTVQRRIGQPCEVGQIVRGIDTDGTLICVLDEDSVYAAGDGLILENGIFAIAPDGVLNQHLSDSSVTQSKIADLAVNTDKLVAGSVTEPKIADGAVIASKLANAAITAEKIAPGAVTTTGIADGAVTAAKIDTSTVQRRIQSCAPGEFIQAVAEDGTVQCGLLSGADFAVSNQGCGLDEVVVGIDVAGNVVCALDANSQYSGVDFATSDQFCEAGQKVFGVNPDGSLNCQDDSDSPTVFEAGLGLELDGNSFNVLLNADQGLKFVGGGLSLEPDDFAGPGLESDGAAALRLALDTLPVDGSRGDLLDSIALSDASDDGITKTISILELSELVDSDSQYTAGEGLELQTNEFRLSDSGVTTPKLADNAVTSTKISAGAVDQSALADDAVTTNKIGAAQVTTTRIAAQAVTSELIADGAVGSLKVNSAEIQLRVGACPGDGYITSIAADGTVTCSAPTGDSYALSNQLCGVDKKIIGIDPQGQVICLDDIDTEYDGTTFALSAQSCPIGEKVTGISANGDVECEVDEDTDTTYTGADFALSNQSCDPGFRVTGVAVDGSLECELDENSTYTAGIAMTLNGAEFSVSPGGITTDRIAVSAVDTDRLLDGAVTSAKIANNAVIATSVDADQIQLRVAPCPAGSYIQSVAADGTPTCVLDADTTYTGDDFALSNQACNVGEKVVGVFADGTLDCVVDTDNNTQYTAGDGLLLDGFEFSVPPAGITTARVADGAITAAKVDSSAVQLRVTGACPAGSFITDVFGEWLGPLQWLYWQ